MNYQPILRNYRQMVRIIRNKENSATSYALGNAYGESSSSFSDVFSTNGVEPTELQIRTLNEMNVPSTSIRRPEAPAVNGNLSSRATSTLYHELNDISKEYLNAQGGENGIKRSDGQPGTKMRTQLGVNSFATKVYAHQSFTEHNNHITEAKKNTKSQSSSPDAFNSHANPSSNITGSNTRNSQFNAFK